MSDPLLYDEIRKVTGTPLTSRTLTAIKDRIETAAAATRTG